MFNRKKSLPLNSLEKFILAHESDYVSYNSQICVEYNGELELAKLRFAVDKCIHEIPLLRSSVTRGILNYHRTYKDKIKLNSESVVSYIDHVLSQDEIDTFSCAKFNLNIPPLFRILISPLGLNSSNRYLLIFNVHHTLCDAAGQFHLLEEIFRAFDGLEIRKEAKLPRVFRYRHLTEYMGWKWVLKNIKEQFKPLSKQRHYQMATLIDHPERLDRLVSSRTIYLTADEQEKILRECKKRDISITEYLTTNCMKAMDKTLNKKGDTKTPIMVYLPKTLRPLLKIRYSLQNILSTVLIVGKREDLHKEEFYSKVKYLISSHKMDKASKFIFSTLLPTAILPPRSVEKIYHGLDQDRNSITSSMLLSAGRVPRSFHFPNSFSDITVWARGTMLKSPGFGVIFTGVSGSETITIEYLKNLSDLSTILDFEENLMEFLLND
jgi:NRPS condensation-like uncharacterized protein